jgi:hypothetical protein
MIRVMDGVAYCGRQDCDTRLGRVVAGVLFLPRGWTPEEADDVTWFARHWTKGARQRRMEWNEGHEYVIPQYGVVVCPKCHSGHPYDRVRK